MPKYAMTIDLSRCMGCRACMVACKVENNTPEGQFWMYVFRLEEGEFPETRLTFLPRPCQHCDNAPCVKVCPVGARYKREDGLVLTDFQRCIGCRYCEVACPYGVNYFHWQSPKKGQYLKWGDDAEVRERAEREVPPWHNPDHDKRYGEERRLTAGAVHYKGVMGKCTFCVHRVEKGLEPACVANCPVRVFEFGDLEDPNSSVSHKLREATRFRLLEDVGTEPRVYYLNGQPPTGEHRQLDAVKGGKGE
jgi:molybdopterin-containing oxidoreductase family iron-sulfur binding subunit